MAKSDTLQGSLDLLVLKILSRRAPLHGYAIMTAVQEISEEVLHVEEGSLYPAIVWKSPVSFARRGSPKPTAGTPESMN